MINDKTRFSIRLIAGLYLMYLAYSLIKNWNINTGSKIVAALFIALFGILGIVLTIISSTELSKMKKKKDEKKD